MTSAERRLVSRRLLFADRASHAFAFLRDLNFQTTASEDTLVQFSNGIVTVDVYHGRRSFEVGVDVNLCAWHDSPFPMSTVADALAPDSDISYGSRPATTSNEVDLALKQYAELLKGEARALIRGDVASFERLREQRRLNAVLLARRVAYGQIAPRAAEAFRERRYRDAVHLFERIEDDLTDVELAKLAYARRQ